MKMIGVVHAERGRLGARVMGDSDLERWDTKPEYRKENRGLGMCNTGARWPGACCLGGIGCDVDHAWIAFNRSTKE